MTHMVNDFVDAWLAKLAKEEEGQTLVEYALIIALVSVALVGALTALTGNLTTVFDAIGTALTAA